MRSSGREVRFGRQVQVRHAFADGPAGRIVSRGPQRLGHGGRQLVQPLLGGDEFIYDELQLWVHDQWVIGCGNRRQEPGNDLQHIL